MPSTPEPQPTLKLGRVVTTANAQGKLNLASVLVALGRHAIGDWGELDDHDKKVNEDGLGNNPGRIMSVYQDTNGVKFWIITEWDRSVTTVLLPEDY